MTLILQTKISKQQWKTGSPGGRLYNHRSWLWSNNDDNKVLTINSGSYIETFPYHMTGKGAQTLIVEGGKYHVLQKVRAEIRLN